MTREGQAQDAFVTANGLRLHVREWGSVDASPVLLLHGLTGNAWEWDPIADALADRYHVLALDQRGHGMSAWASDYAPDRMVEDIDAIVSALGLGRLSIVGHSMGGINAYLYTARHPEVVERLVIVDIGPDSITPAAAALWHDALRASAGATYGEPEEAVAEWRAANPRAREPELRHFVRYNLGQDVDGGWRWRFDGAHLGSFITGAPDAAEQWTALQGVTCPTLVIRGADSEVLRASSAARMVRELARGDVVEIPLAGHDLTVEHPEALRAHVRRFLAAAWC